MQNHQWIYRRAPDGAIGVDNYDCVSAPVDAALDRGEVLLAARYWSVDPYMRINQARGDTWMPPHPLNQVQSSAAIGEVLASNAEGFRVGESVLAPIGWQTQARLHASQLTRIDPRDASSAYLGVLGMPGRTAWFGLTDIARVHPGELVAVTGAAGAVGLLVVQFAKLAGARVLAIAGGEEKCKYLRQLGLDWVIDHRDANLLERLAAIGKIDVLFDNVGGAVTDALFTQLALRARVVICGQMSQYQGRLDVPELAPRFLHHVLYQRATIQGVLARDYLHRHDEMLSIVAPLVRSGRVILPERIIDGFEQLPAALAGLFTNSTVGKVVVRA